MVKKDATIASTDFTRWIYRVFQIGQDGETPASPSNPLSVGVSSPVTSEGEINVANNIAFVQADAVYNLIPSNFREFSGTGGSTGTEDKKFKVSTGTTIFGYGAIQSFRALNYKP